MLILKTILEETLTQRKTMKDDIIQMIKQIEDKARKGDATAFMQLIEVFDIADYSIQNAIRDMSDQKLRDAMLTKLKDNE
jgi:ABC-type iron transport system FetAB ATPase subunit